MHLWTSLWLVWCSLPISQKYTFGSRWDLLGDGITFMYHNWMGCKTRMRQNVTAGWLPFNLCHGWRDSYHYKPCNNPSARSLAILHYTLSVKPGGWRGETSLLNWNSGCSLKPCIDPQWHNQYVPVISVMYQWSNHYEMVLRMIFCSKHSIWKFH